jgi:hypothetical protein
MPLFFKAWAGFLYTACGPLLLHSGADWLGAKSADVIVTLPGMVRVR